MPSPTSQRLLLLDIFRELRAVEWHRLFSSVLRKLVLDLFFLSYVLCAYNSVVVDHTHLKFSFLQLCFIVFLSNIYSLVCGCNTSTSLF
jgi:hypothetical protein